ncbi:hypothetical protein RvY_18978 [Ramazzottius varieornatus]|uniref:CSN12-like protein n=1 Tax=Ramazzottius varieornatus TaxID=947166 RepID=A0A1D1W7R4_RAMVA|nr:hypothetical protein RvY_18978 [Ramazzottius varieornatus]
MAFFKRNRASSFGGSSSANGQYDVADYTSQVLQAFENEDGTYFSNLLSLTDEHGDYLLESSLCQPEDGGSPEPWDLSVLEDSVSSEFIGLVASHLRCVRYIARYDLSSALSAQEELSKLVAIMLPKIQNEDVIWFLPTVTTVARDLSSLALKADQQQQNRITMTHEGQTTSIDRAFNSIQQIVRTCAAEKGATDETSKKRALVPLVNQLFRLCFRTGRANLCKPLVRTIENLRMLDRCPASQVVTYYYFAGKLAVVEGDYVLAEQRFTLAYLRCPAYFHTNMKAILRFLLPLRLRMDVRPSSTLLRQYNLYQYADLVQALQRADIALFQQKQNAYEKDFIRWSIYYLIDNLRLIMFRHVFRKLCKVLNHHIVAVQDMTVALRVAGYKTPVEEEASDADAECVMVNLIGEDLLKAYVSWQLKKIVVAKVGAFPTLKKALKTAPE